MFFLKRIFSHCVKKIKFCQEYKEYARNFEQVTNTEYEKLKQMYSCDILPTDVGRTEHYPVYDFPSKFDIYASMYSFAASNEDAKVFELLVRNNFSYSGNKLYTRINDKEQTESLHLNIRNIFSIKEIEVCTNSNTFIQLIKETRITCPPPWLAFPDLKPDFYVPTQGELEYYDRFFWDPFWSSLDENEKGLYYAVENIPKGWEEQLRFRDELKKLD